MTGRTAARRVAAAAVAVCVAAPAAACGGSYQLTSQNVLGTWHAGDCGATLQFEKGHVVTAKHLPHEPGTDGKVHAWSSGSGVWILRVRGEYSDIEVDLDDGYVTEVDARLIGVVARKHGLVIHAGDPDDDSTTCYLTKR